MSIVLVATIRPLPEHRDEIVALLERTIEQSHAEPGCELYALHESRDSLVMIEKWADKDALSAHSTSPHMAALIEGTAGKLSADMDVQMLSPHPVGDAVKGAL